MTALSAGAVVQRRSDLLANDLSVTETVMLDVAGSSYYGLEGRRTSHLGPPRIAHTRGRTLRTTPHPVRCRPGNLPGGDDRVPRDPRRARPDRCHPVAHDRFIRQGRCGSPCTRRAADDRLVASAGTGWTPIRRTLRSLVRVYVLLIAMRGVIAAFSLPQITNTSGPRWRNPDRRVPTSQLRYARRVGWAIVRAAPRTPTNSNCYPQALTAWWLLHRRRIPTTFYYGAAFDDDRSALEAHVWLRCGNLMVTGGGPHPSRFAPLTWFADVPALRTPRAVNGDRSATGKGFASEIGLSRRSRDPGSAPTRDCPSNLGRCRLRVPGATSSSARRS